MERTAACSQRGGGDLRHSNLYPTRDAGHDQTRPASAKEAIIRVGVFFHILSTGGGSGASRITRYIAERDKDLAREGPGSRRLFSEDQDNLSYHRADRILDPDQGQPDKDDLIHFSVMIEEEEFDKLGADEKEKQARFREAVREAMKGMSAELNVEDLTWVAGIHRNSQNPHTHIVMHKDAIQCGTGKHK